MAGDWIKMRSKLDQCTKVAIIASQLDIGIDQVVYGLYRLTCWLNEHGKYGKLDAKYECALNAIFGSDISSALKSVGWLSEHNGVLLISGFTKAHQERKSLGVKIRRQVLASGACLVCGCSTELQVDHNIPIARGGSSDIENLIALCRRCNISKGVKTLREFME